MGPSYQAFIAEQSTEQTRGRVYGLVEGIYAVVGVVGPPIGGYLVERFNFRLMFSVAAALYLTATVIRLVMARGARQAETAANISRDAPSLKGLWTNLAAMTGLVLGGGLVVERILRRHGEHSHQHGDQQADADRQDHADGLKFFHRGSGLSPGNTNGRWVMEELTGA